jgi:hypothetical protein
MAATLGIDPAVLLGANALSEPVKVIEAKVADGG